MKDKFGREWEMVVLKDNPWKMTPVIAKARDLIVGMALLFGIIWCMGYLSKLGS